MKVTRTSKGFTVELTEHEGRCLQGYLTVIPGAVIDSDEDYSFVVNFQQHLGLGLHSNDSIAQAIEYRIRQISDTGSDAIRGENHNIRAEMRILAEMVRNGNLEAAQAHCQRLSSRVLEQLPMIAYPHLGLHLRQP